MKKTYIIPQIEVVRMEQYTPIAQSPLQFGETVNDTEGDVKYQGDWEIFDYGDE